MIATFFLYFFLAVIFIQLVYLIIFFVAFSGDKQSPITTTPVSVSVIVCAHDEERNLRELIPILLAQEYPDFEVIIVDDRSNDGTFDYLLEETGRNSKLRMVQVRETPRYMNSKKFAVTLGVKAAKNDWILLTDADCRPGKNWISGMARHFVADKKIGIGYSPYEKYSGVLNLFIRFETLLTAIQYIGFALSGKPYMGVGRNLAYRRDLFMQSNGFNKHLGVLGGDDDLFVNEHSTGSNVAVAMGPDVLVRSLPKITWSGFFDQKLRHLSVGKKYKLGDQFLLGMFSITWILSVLGWFALPFLGVSAAILGGALVLRWIVLIMVFATASRKLGESFEEWKVPFLDFIYGFYYLVAGPIALVTKRVKWKN